MICLPKSFRILLGLIFCGFTTLSVLGARDDENVDLDRTNAISNRSKPKPARRQCPRYWGGGASGCAQHCNCRYLEVCIQNECYLSKRVVGAVALSLVGTLTVITLRRSQMPLNDEEGFADAALYIRDAIEGVRRPKPRDTWWARRCYAFHMQHGAFLRMYAWILLCLSCWEQPVWCEVRKYEFNGERLCESELYPSFPIPYMTRNKHIVIEFVFLIPFVLDAILIGYAQGGNFCTSKGNIFRVVMLLLNCVDGVYAYLDNRYALRLGHYIRIYFLLDHSHELRKIFELVLRILPHLGSVFFLMFFYITLFAFVGCILFHRNTAEGNHVFSTLFEGQWNLLILITTANFPDVMMPAYREGRTAFLFFFVFIVFGIWFMVNLTTASVVSAYEEQDGINEQERAELEAAAMASVYEALNADSPLTEEKLVQFIGEIPKRCPILANIKDRNLQSVIAQVNMDGDVITCEELKALIPILKLNAEVAFPPPLLESLIPGVENTAWWIATKAFVTSSLLDRIINAVVIFAFALMVREHWEEFMGQPPVVDWYDGLRARLEYFFCAFYILEMLLKILVFGFPRYWHNLRHRFDLFCTVLSGTLLASKLFQDASGIQALISLIRIPRLLSVFTEIQTFREITDTFAEVASKVTSVVGFLLCAMYLFSVAGCDLFGGVINLDERSAYYTEVAASDFGTVHYWENNFNDIPSGMVTLFELIVVNNWQVIASGFVAACGKQARIFFIAFYIFGVLIIFNIVLAIILDTFRSSYVRVGQAYGETKDLHLSAEARIVLFEDALRKIGVDPLDIEKKAAAAKHMEAREDD